MEAKDLMVGNYLEIDGIVCQIDARTIFDFCNDNRTYKPIPLTGDWLKSFGAILHENEYYFDFVTHHLSFNQMGDDWYPIYSELGEFTRDEDQQVSLNSIKYVHQLQNLVYALQGYSLINQ